jgi:hypothetical protein
MAAVGGLDQMRRAVGALLAINPSTLRNWISRKEIDTGTRPRVSTEVSGELTVLRREVAGLRRAERDPQDRLGVFAAAELGRLLDLSAWGGCVRRRTPRGGSLRRGSGNAGDPELGSRGLPLHRSACALAVHSRGLAAEFTAAAPCGTR